MKAGAAAADCRNDGPGWLREPRRPSPGRLLDDAFQGVATGHGRFKSGLIGLDRGFTVTTRGRRSGDIFVLVQQFRFDDGETDRRVWRFRRTGPNNYAGTRQDVIGEAKVRVDDRPDHHGL